MANSEDIINWPFRDPTSPTKEAVTAVKAVQPRTPYQPHHGYIQAAQKYAIRKRLTVYLVSLAVAVFSDIVSITLYILVERHEHEYAWLLRAWVVVSAGLTVLFALLAASFWFNYRRAKRLEGSDQGEKDTPLKALGRKGLFDSFSWAGEVVDADAGEEARRESQSVAREPLVKHDHGQRDPTSPVTVLHRPETSHSNSSHAISNTLHALSGHRVVPNHILSPNNGRACACTICTPPPRFPSPAKLSAGAAHRDVSEEDPFYSVARDSPVSPLTVREVAKVRRSDSLKKLREATLRRKQAFETLK